MGSSTPVNPGRTSCISSSFFPVFLLQSLTVLDFQRPLDTFFPQSDRSRRLPLLNRVLNLLNSGDTRLLTKQQKPEELIVTSYHHQNFAPNTFLREQLQPTAMRMTCFNMNIVELKDT